MNVGDYIRIDGYISKIGHIKTSSSGKTYVQWKQSNGLLASANIKLIEKSSSRIIDLIEVGDYVNGRKVSKINLDKTLNKEKCILCADTNYDCLDTVYKNEDIKSIVTHEQMEAMQYRVEE